MSIQLRNHHLVITAIFLTIVLLAACGKKGPPTLTSFEKPDAPSSVTAVHRAGAMTLRWDYPRKQEGVIAEFIVLRATGVDFEKLSHLEKDKRMFVDRDITTGITYRYKIIAQNARGVYSDDSPIVEATPAIPPLPPTGLSSAVKGDMVVLSWTPLNAADKFNVYKANKQGGYGLMPVNKTPLSEPHFTDSFSVNTVVYYTVRSLTGSAIRDEGEASEELVVDPADLVPARPENVQAYPSSDRVFLAWSEPAEPWVTGFRVYKRTGSSEYILIGETQIPTFVDNDRSAARRDYRITAVGPAKEGPPAEITNVVYTPQR